MDTSKMIWNYPGILRNSCSKVIYISVNMTFPMKEFFTVRGKWFLSCHVSYISKYSSNTLFREYWFGSMAAALVNILKISNKKKKLLKIDIYGRGRCLVFIKHEFVSSTPN